MDLIFDVIALGDAPKEIYARAYRAADITEKTLYHLKYFSHEDLEDPIYLMYAQGYNIILGESKYLVYVNINFNPTCMEHVVYCKILTKSNLPNSIQYLICEWDYDDSQYLVYQNYPERRYNKHTPVTRNLYLLLKIV
jgi:hypothetical protein